MFLGFLKKKETPRNMSSAELARAVYGGMATHAGVEISPESATRIVAVLTCVRILSETVASIPLIVYRRLPNGGEERVMDHPVARLLHGRGQPNHEQTAYEGKEML